MKFLPGKRSRVYAIRKWQANGYDFHIAREDSHGTMIAVGRPVEFEALTEAAERQDPGPTFFLDQEGCQGLIDELWRVGFRPAEGTGSAGALRQAEDHLASLKAIAFKLVGVAR